MKYIFQIIAAVFILSSGTVLADKNFATIYNRDLGLIKQIRTIEIHGPDQPLRFTDVAAKLIPTSVHLRALSGNKNFQVLEQNFEFDLVSSEKILEKYIDHPVEIIAENGDLITGILLSRRGGSLVIRTAEGIKILGWSSKMSINVKELPEGLITRPTLIWALAGVTAGMEKLEVSYLTGGMGWQAEYVGVLNEPASHIDLEAWVSVTNQSGATFKDATLKLVAGEVHRAGRAVPERRMVKTMAGNRYDSAVPPGFEEREFFEYHIYELERLTTLKDNQVKQIALFPPAGVTSEKKFFYNARRDPEKVEVRVIFRNDETSGLGKPLPAGVFRIYQKDGDSLEFIGEDRIDHTSRNEEVKITMGKAFDLVGKRKVVDRKKVSDRSERRTVEIELRNNKKTDGVAIIVEEDLNYPFWEIEDTTDSYRKKDAHRVEFSIPVKADEKRTLRYTVLIQW
jgi:hypothetical protein